MPSDAQCRGTVELWPMHDHLVAAYVTQLCERETRAARRLLGQGAAEVNAYHGCYDCHSAITVKAVTHTQGWLRF